MKRQGIEALQTIAQKGYAPASMALATMMANGNIIPQNLPQAKQIFTELAKQNVPNARESLASVEKLLLRRINKLPPLLCSQLLKIVKRQ